MAHYISYQGKEIRFHSEGIGKPLVLLHGFLESLSIWKDFSTQLSKQFRVISIDLPGHGLSEVIDTVHSMEMMAAVVKNILDHCGLKSCVMAGHSMGGYVMLAFARQYPEYLKGICLFNSNALADSPEAKVNRSRAVMVVKQNRQGYISQFIPDLFAPANVGKFQKEIAELREAALKMSKEGIIASLEGMKARRSHLDFLEKTAIPVMFIVGKKDPRSDFALLQDQIALPTHSESLILSECGHMGWLEAKDVTLPALGSFAARMLS